MTTPEEALRLAQDYVAQYRPGVRVVGLLQDDTDYLATLEQDTEWPGGGTSVFVGKATGQVWTDNIAALFDKYAAMTPVG